MFLFLVNQKNISPNRLGIISEVVVLGVLFGLDYETLRYEPLVLYPSHLPQTHNSAYNLRQIAEARHGPQLKKIPVSKAYSL